MGHSRESIHSILEQETRLFCQAELARQALMTLPSARYNHNDDPARATNCGLATGVLQNNLREYHGVVIDRIQGTPPEMPAYGYNHRRFSHVLLRHEDFLLDPTYGQLFGFAGIDRNNPAVSSSSYPESLSLVVDLNNPDETLDPVAESLEEATHKEYSHKDEVLAPLRGLGKNAILNILRDVYDTDSYEASELSPDQSNFESIQKIILLTQDYRI